jgi:hypothetical protein
MVPWPTGINASEIRLELSGADEPKLLAAPKRVTRPRPRQSHVAAAQPNARQQQEAEAQRKSCSDGPGPLGSYALRARGSEVMPIWRFIGPRARAIFKLLYWFFVLTVRLLAPGHKSRSLGTHWHCSPPGAML